MHMPSELLATFPKPVYLFAFRQVVFELKKVNAKLGLTPAAVSEFQTEFA
jgi:hypothetical protein